MKRLSLSALTILCACFCFAQSTPQALNYQAVARTSSGQIIPSQNIAVRFSIIDGTATGALVYQETQTAFTNNFGLFTLAIGKGTVVSGVFASIAWETGNKFLKVEIAPQGGTNYLLQGTTQLLSVPYALYSERTKLLAGNSTITISGGNTIMGNYQPANNTILITGNTIAGNYQAANNTVLVTGNTIAGNYQAANNTVLVTGNTIAGNYQAANNTVVVNGNTIAGNYQAGNNTVTVTGNTITGNYQAANSSISITGNTIAGNYQAGAGVSITGNTISAVGSSLWVVDANGIHNQSGYVGIGIDASATNALIVKQKDTNGFSGAMDILSNDTWHTVYRFRNLTSAQEWQFMVGGSNNTYERAGSLAIYNATAGGLWLLHGDAVSNYLGVGSAGVFMPQPKSRLHVFAGDVNIDQIGSGIILKSPNGNCWRVTIDNAGNLVRTAIACP